MCTMDGTNESFNTNTYLIIQILSRVEAARGTRKRYESLEMACVMSFVMEQWLSTVWCSRQFHRTHDARIEYRHVQRHYFHFIWPFETVCFFSRSVFFIPLSRINLFTMTSRYVLRPLQTTPSTACPVGSLTCKQFYCCVIEGGVDWL